MEEFTRDFKGVWIPKEIWLDENLSCTDKCLIAEINSLDNGEGCYASNQYLSKFMQVSETAISVSISKLKKLGYLEQISFDGRLRKLKVCLKVNLKSDYKNYLSPYNNILSKDNIYNNKKDYNKNDNKKEISKDISKKSSEKHLFSSKKLNKKDIRKNEILEIFKKYFLDEEILEKLKDWLAGQYELNKMPTSNGIELSLQELSRLSKNDVIAAINNSIKCGYVTFYINKNNNISRDGINHSEDNFVNPEDIAKSKRALQNL